MAPTEGTNNKDGSGGGPFHRVKDKRLVKQVLSIHHQPQHWLPMDITSTECKLMEVRKFSAEYHEINIKFRKPRLELISAYAVQNPFLYGMYVLRREQIKMQHDSMLHSKFKGDQSGLKEKQFFYPTTFENLETILRHNFDSVANLDQERQPYPLEKQQDVKFYSSSLLANQAYRGTTNPRILIMAKVSIRLCHLVSNDDDEKTGFGPRRDRHGSPIDTLCNADKSVFFKFNPNEMYPEYVLVYRDLNGPADAHTSRLTDFVKHCQLSYRSGTRFNPQEQQFQGSKKNPENPDEIQVDGE